MKVLVASRDAENVDVLGKYIEDWGFEVVFASDAVSVLEKMQNVKENIIIAVIDQDLEGMQIEDLFFKIRNKTSAGYQYCIVLGEDLSEDDHLILFNAGVDRILNKSTDLIQLRMQLQIARRLMEYQLRQQIVQYDLWNQANQDVLTNIPNRRAIDRALERQATLCAAREQPLGILMIDLDYFKQINDNFGHDSGDIVLQKIADRMRKHLRSEDMIGRFGGEEFLAIIPNCSGEELLRLGERLRKTVNTPIQTSDKLIPVSCSIGIGVYDVMAGDTDPYVSLKRADQALYVAKEMGRNRVVPAWSLHERTQKFG